MTFRDTDTARAANERGRQRQRELGREHAEAVRINSQVMLASLNREPAPDEIGLAESIASLFYKAAKLRALGRSDLEHLREAGILMRDWRQLPRGQVPATEPTA